MAFEMICGQCRGNLLVEQFGVVVACPHCGAHLSIPAPEGSAPAPIPAPAPVPPPSQPIAPEPQAPAPFPQFTTEPFPAPAPVSAPVMSVSEPAATAVAATNSVVDEQLPFFGQPAFEPPQNVVTAETTPSDSSLLFGESSEPEPAPNVVAQEVPVTANALVPEPIPSAEPHPMESLFGAAEETPVVAAELMVPESATQETIATVAPEITQTAIDAEPPTVDMSASGTGLSALIGGTVVETVTESVTNDLSPAASESTDTTDSAAQQPTSDSTTTTAAADSKAVAQNIDTDHVLMAKTSVLLLLSYTSAVTIGFLYLFFHLMSRKDVDYGLESLPDLVPKKKNVSILLVPERAEMPDGHELKIGQSQTFGNIKVTVTKVTRGPIQFVHHSRKSDDVRLPSSPVLKLWLKFENVSQDQEIPPLDSHLLFTRSGKTRFDWRANQFVCREEDKANTDKRKVYVYDHNFQSPWDLANLPLEKPLKPKESRLYYVPSGENDLELLTGSLLWRVHFRKGYGPKGRGVTTIFEVHFESGEIKDEQA